MSRCLGRYEVVWLYYYILCILHALCIFSIIHWLHPQLSCLVHPTLRIVFFLMSSKPPFHLVASCFYEPNLPPPTPTLSSLPGLTPPLSSISFCASVSLSFSPEKLCELHRGLAVCLRMVAASILPSQLSWWPGCTAVMNLARRIPLLFPQGISLNPLPPICQPALLLRYSSKKFYSFGDSSCFLLSDLGSELELLICNY